MALTRSLLEDAAREYEAEEPLALVESEHVELLPGTFASGSFGWRDAEWVVQWYYRRHLGAYPDADRRRREAAYGENDFETVLDTLSTLAGMDGTADRLEALTRLSGVDVPVASAFLQFTDPDRYLAIGEREWRALAAAGELDAPYPDPPSIADYGGYHEVCMGIADRCDVDAWTLYRALWRLGPTDVEPD